MAKQHVTTELFYDGAWNDHTSSVYARNPISITRGRGDEQGEASPSVCTLTFDNRTGTFNPRNPAGDLYGLIGRNTPLRISAGSGPLLRDDFGRSVSGDWTGGSFTWVNSPGGADWDVNGTHGTHTHPDTNVLRYSTVDTGEVDHRVRATVKLSAATLTGANASSWVLGRFADTSNYYAALASMTTAGDVTLGIFKRVAGSLSTVASTITTHASYGGLFATYQFTIELLVEGSTLRAKIWDSSNHAEPASYNLTATDTSLTTGTSAGVTDRRETGNTNANLEFRYDSFLAVPGTVRFTGEVSSWKPRRAIKGDAWTEVTASGVLRRLGQSGALRSVLWREILLNDPLAFWPVTDGSNASQAASALPAGAPLAVTATDFSSGDDVALRWSLATWADWLEPIGTAPADTGLELIGPVAMSAAATEWAGDFVFALDPNNVAGSQSVLTLRGNGAGSAAEPRIDWSLSYTVGVGWSFDRLTYNPTISGTNVGTGALDLDDGRVHHGRMTTVRDGADVDWEVFIDGTSVASGTLVGSDWQPVAIARGFTQAGADGRTAVGFLAVWDTATPPANAANAAVVGRAGETAADRVERLCDEEVIPFTLIGTAADTAAMGPQPIDTFNAVVAECERTDAGQAYEARVGGLAYRTRVDLYNPTAVLTLDYDAGQIAPPLEPDIDDLNVRNDVTVKRPDGSFARAVQTTGTLNVNNPRDDADGVGRYAVEVEVNTETDDVLPDHAGLRLHFGTVPDTRWPQVTIDLDADPTLVTDAARLDISHMFEIDNIPDDETTATQQVAVGSAETIGTHRRLITLNCVPASPYDVFVLDTDVLDGPAVLAL